ncbi:XRE family transcriptional regulator, partial [Leptolyngbya sp. FACHB-36]|nr:XRE family transcriptional regulator [Leptolyngbya sp. FACHB-36]
SRWVSEERDPLAEAVFETYQALRSLNRDAAKEFIQLYLGISDEDGL